MEKQQAYLFFFCKTSGVFPPTPECFNGANARRLKTNLRGFSSNPGAFQWRKLPEVENKPPGFFLQPRSVSLAQTPEVESKPPGLSPRNISTFTIIIFYVVLLRSTCFDTNLYMYM
ncbi:hypothetical protein EGI32_13500 [Ferruginibacter sp. HRS2-29]|nr:hypothetical protein [Ferruginibacter sp. HRS2-29]